LVPTLTFLVPVLDVGSAGDEDGHQLLVAAGARQRQRRVVVALRLQDKTLTQ